MTDFRRVQAPVHYAVQTSPTRAGSYPGPYTIINPNANAATVWIADNAGLQAGQGTPVYPGTSIQWNKDGDLWAVADAPGTQIIISYDVADWQPNPAAIAAAILNSGVLIIDDPQTLYQFSVTGPGNTTLLDISRYQSLNISIAKTIATAGVDFLTITFSDGGVTTYRVPLVFTGVGQIWTASIPCYGSGARISIGTAARYDIFISGSYRPIDTIKQRIDEVSGTPADTDLVWTPFALAGSGFFNVDLPPWHGEIEIYSNVSVAPAIAPGVSNIGLSKQNAAGVMTRFYFELFTASPGNTAWQCRTSVQSNGDGLRVAVQNSTASTITGVLRVTPKTGAAVGT